MYFHILIVLLLLTQPSIADQSENFELSKDTKIKILKSCGEDMQTYCNYIGHDQVPEMIFCLAKRLKTVDYDCSVLIEKIINDDVN